jgi:hypothetical protein
MRKRRFITTLQIALLAVFVALPNRAQADPIFWTKETEQFLIIGLGPVNDSTVPPQSTVGIGSASLNSNFELGAMRAPVPSTDDFLYAKLNESSPGTGGPTLLGAVPNMPANARPVEQGVSYSGNIALTHPDAIIQLSNIGVYADPSVGIQLSNLNTRSDAVQGSNSFFNDLIEVNGVMVPGFPNTFEMDSNGNLVPSLQEGVVVEADPDSDSDTLNANQAARVVDRNDPGVTITDFTALLAELDTAVSAIGSALADATLDLTNSSNAGKLDGGFPGNTTNFGTATTTGPISLSASDETLTLTLQQAGITVVDILTGGNAFVLENMNLVIDALDPLAQVIFRLPGSTGHEETGGDPAQVMDISNANVLAGNGIGKHNIMFYTDAPNNGVFFSFDNTILNGITFWDLGFSGGGIHINNAQGSVQLVADFVNLQDVRFDRWAYDSEIAAVVAPEPSSFLLLGLGGFVLIGYSRRRMRQAA